MRIRRDLDEIFAAIESADPNLDDRDGPEIFLYAAIDLRMLRPEMAEDILFDKVRNSTGIGQRRYLRTLMYLGSVQAGLAKRTFAHLIALLELSKHEPALNECVLLALCWIEFHNLREEEIRLLVSRLTDERHAGIERWTPRILKAIERSLSYLQERLAASDALSIGRIEIVQDIVTAFRLDCEQKAVFELGDDFTEIAANFRKLIAWTTFWIGSSTRSVKMKRSCIIKEELILSILRTAPLVHVEVAWNVNCLKMPCNLKLLELKLLHVNVYDS